MRSLFKSFESHLLVGYLLIGSIQVLDISSIMAWLVSMLTLDTAVGTGS
jgi:hypothetical protein